MTRAAGWGRPGRCARSCWSGSRKTPITASPSPGPRAGTQYTETILAWAAEHGLSGPDLTATVTDLTAWSIADAYERYVLPRYRASELIVGGGGSYNRTLLGFLTARMAPYGVAVRTQEDLGWSSDAKEAIAFALMADRCAMGLPNTLPTVTGAQCPAVMGKLSLPPMGAGSKEGI